MKIYEVKQNSFPGFEWNMGLLDKYFTVTCLNNGITRQVWPEWNENDGYVVEGAYYTEFCCGWPIKKLTKFCDEQAVMNYLESL